MNIGKNNEHCSYYVDGYKLMEVDLEKDLGVRISVCIKCFQQCLYACYKASKVLGMIKRTLT